MADAHPSHVDGVTCTWPVEDTVHLLNCSIALRVLRSGASLIHVEQDTFPGTAVLQRCDPGQNGFAPVLHTLQLL